MQIDLLTISSLNSLMINQNVQYLKETRKILSTATGKVVSKLDPIQNMDVTKIDLSNVQFIKSSLLQQKLTALGMLSLEKKKRKLERGSIRRKGSQET